MADKCTIGPWSERHLHAHQTAHQAAIEGKIVDATGHITDLPTSDDKSARSDIVDEKVKDVEAHKAGIDAEKVEKIAESEIVQAPTFKEAMGVIFSLQCLLLSAPYACSFGGELAINSILGAYYNKNFPSLGQTKSGQWYVASSETKHRMKTYNDIKGLRCSVSSMFSSVLLVESSRISSTARPRALS